MKKRMLAWALLVCMLVTLLPVSAYAEGKIVVEPADAVILSDSEGSQTVTELDRKTLLTTQAETQDTTIVASGTCGANLTWTLDDAGTLTISGEGTMMNCTDDGTPWEHWKGSIKRVEIGSGVTSIGDYVLYNCYNLTEITIASGVTSVGSYAFYNCDSLTSITIPSGVTRLDDHCFAYCDELQFLTIPKSVVTIGNYAFNGCSNLVNVTYDGTVRERDELTDNGWSVIGNDPLYSASWTYGTPTVTSTIYSFADLHRLVENYDGSDTYVYYNGTDTFVFEESITLPEHLYFCADADGSTVRIPVGITLTVSSKTINAFYVENLVVEGKMTAYRRATVYRTLTGDVNWLRDVIASGTCGTQGDNLTWTLDDQGTLTISGEGAMENYYLAPGNSVLPAWDSYPYQHVIVGNGVTSIGSHAFSYSRINDIQLPETLVSIGHHAFFESMLSSVDLPKNLTVIESSAFADCGALTAISVHQENPAFGSLDGVLFSKDLTKLLYFPAGITGEYTVPASVKTIGEDSFFNCNGVTGIVLPNSLESIGKGAFSYCRGLTSVTIPGSVTNIDADAFYYCNGLTNVTIPASVTSLGGNPFPGCEAITDFGLDENNTSFCIEDGILYDREKTRLIWCLAGKSGAVTVPEGVQSIAASAFRGCRGMTSITIPASVSSFGDCAFEGCSSLKDIYFGGSAAQKSTLLGSDPYSWANYYLRGAYWHFAGDFYGDIHSFAELKEAVSAYDGSDLYVFYNGKDTFVFEESITLPEHLYFCADADGSSVLIPEGVSLIVESETKNAFYAEELVVRGSMTVHVEALWYRRLTGRLNWVYVVDSGECGAQGDNLIWKLYNNGMLTISGEGEMADYSANDIPWYDHKSAITCLVVKNGVTSIGRAAYSECNGLTSITLPDSVTSIGDSAFVECFNLKSITIPDSVMSIGNFAFYSCKSLQAIALPKRLTVLGQQAFEGCSALADVTLPEDLTSIGLYTFGGCALKVITIPAGVTSIAPTAFECCSNLTAIHVTPANSAFVSVDGVLYNREMTTLLRCPEGKTGAITVPEGVTAIGVRAFCFCDLTDIVLPDTVNSFEENSFANCYNLRNFTIPVKVKNIPEAAFFGCKALTSLTIPNGVTTIGKGSFSGCTSLATIVIPASLISIDDYAFNTAGLTDVYYAGTEEQKNALIDNGWSTEGNDPLFNAVWHCEPLEEGWDNCGETVYWKLDTGTRTLSIEGVGDIWDMTAGTIPWRDEISRVYYVEIGEGVTGIGAQTFLDAGNLRRVTLPESLQRIGASAFSGCNKLTGVVFPAGVTSIGKGAFTGCGSVKEIVFEGEPPMVAADSFTGVTATAHYPCTGWWEEDCQNYGGTLTWVMDHDWEEVTYTFDYVGLTVTGNRACRLDPAHAVKETVALTVKTLTMPNETADGEYVLESATFRSDALEQQTLSFRLPALGTLSVLDLPEELTAIEAEAFAGADCEAVLLPAGVKSIGSGAFAGCAKLRYVYFPAGIEIAPDAFEGCEDLLLIRTK